LRVEVKDSGIGITMADQGRLFALFTQVDGSLTRRYEGMGLGLALSKRLVESMGGAIGVQSDVGMGST
jgi:signal transduction histidine kinase